MQVLVALAVPALVTTVPAGATTYVSLVLLIKTKEQLILPRENCSLVLAVVKLLVAVVVLHERVVQNSAGLGILELPILSEHTLIYALVDDDQSEHGRLSLVAVLSDGLAELAYLFADDLVAHLLADTVAEHDDSLRRGANVLLVLGESVSETAVEVLLDELLVLGLNDEVRPVRGAVLVG